MIVFWPIALVIALCLLLFEFGMVLFCLFTFTLLTLNANGLWQADKRARLIYWFRSLSHDVDVIGQQEVHCVSILEGQSWFRHTGYSFAVSPASNHSSGIIILLRPHISFSHSWPGHCDRSLMVELKVSDNTFRVCSVYAPNRNPDRDRFLSDVATLINPAVPTLLCGDFKSVFDRSADLRGSYPFDNFRESTANLVSLFSECSVVDVWRSLHPTD